jgi:hypothetical protein
VRRAVVMNEDERPVGLLSFLAPALQPSENPARSWSETAGEAAMAG